MKKIVELVISVGLVIGLVQIMANISKQQHAEQKEEETKLVEEYKTCLDNHFTQRDYCARQLGHSYEWLDNLLEQNGYTYEQIGYDLYVVEK